MNTNEVIKNALYEKADHENKSNADNGLFMQPLGDHTHLLHGFPDLSYLKTIEEYNNSELELRRKNYEIWQEREKQLCP